MKLIHTNTEKIKLFNTLILETHARCNRSCSFCPVSEYKRPEKFMPIEWIEKVILELIELKFKDSVNLYFYDEPGGNPKLSEIASMFRKALPKVSIMINSNCDYFRTAEDIAKLIRAGINQMELNIYSTGESEEQIHKAIQNETRVKALVEELKNEFPIDETLPVYRPIKPTQIAIRIVPKYNFTQKNRGKGLQFTTNRAGNIPGYIPNLREPLKKGCVRPFRHMVVNSEGSVVLCCNDYYGSTNFGNIATNSLVEIWNNVNFHKYRLKLQNKDRNIHLCDVCDYNGGSYVWAINEVTFGDEKDKEILASDLRQREKIFTSAPTYVKKQNQ